MRIAMLVSTGPQTLSGEEVTSEEEVLRLAEGLAAKNQDMTLFTARASGAGARGVRIRPFNPEGDSALPPELLEILHISRLFEQANEYDLIHNLMGCLPLVYAGLVETPVLTTLRTRPTEKTLPVYRQYDGRGFYVDVEGAGRSPELTYLGTVKPEQAVSDYLGIYTEIVDRTAREDHRPWGFYEVLSDKEDHKVKRITVYPGKRLSYQRHRRRSEHWHVVDGQAIVTLDGRDIPLSGGDSIDISRGGAHRVANPGKENMVFVEVQKGDYFGEDDIERLEDDFGRS